MRSFVLVIFCLKFTQLPQAAKRWQKPWKNRTQKEQKFENKKILFISFKHSVIFL